MKGCLLFFIFMSILANVSAQFQSIEVGIDGLTCSLCVRGVEKSIRKLPYIKEIEVDLAGTNMQIQFEEKEQIQIEKIAKQVVDAGFSVRYVKASLKQDQILQLDSEGFQLGNDLYKWVTSTPKVPNGIFSIQFLGEAFQSKKEFKAYESDLERARQETNPLLYSHVYFVKL